MMTLRFVKYTGTGNDFVIFDNREGDYSNLTPIILSALCHRQYGVGADGVIFLEKSTTTDWRMRIFNPDGQETEMCGNGIRCLFKYLLDKDLESHDCTISTLHHQLAVTKTNGMISADMPLPTQINLNLPLQSNNHNYTVHYLNTGVPHAVLFVDQLENIDLNNVAPSIRHHSLFGPEGANVNFVIVGQDNNLYMRTFERGVEAETLACGTGAVASAIISVLLQNLQSPIYVHVKSGEVLIVEVQHRSQHIIKVTMSGQAHRVFQGNCEIEDLIGIKGIEEETPLLV